MKKKALIALMAILCGFKSLSAQETFKVMFYNLLNFPIQEPAASRLLHLEVILADYQPDLFMVCELNNLDGAERIFGKFQGVNSNIAMATFVTNSSDDNDANENELQNLIYYDRTKFVLESQTVITTKVRDFNHYVLKLNTVEQNTDPIYLDAIVCHLKSSNSASDKASRLEMVQTLTQYLNNLQLASNHHVLLGGDLNLYTNSENAFEELLYSNMDSDIYPLVDPDPNRIVFVDPANRLGCWRCNTSYLDVYTQSTRQTGSGLGGAGAGFDDRFDFILASQNMLTSPDLQYVDNSYKVYGNNNNINCYDQSINSANCAGPDYSQAIRESLYNFSDHLPVTLQITTNQNLLSVADNKASLNIMKIIGSNLVHDNLNIEVNLDGFDATKLIIYNGLGQLILEKPVNTSSNLKIDVGNLAHGMYYIIASDMNVEPLKFVKLN